MNTMNMIAYDNLNILNEDKFMTHYLIADGNKLSLIEKDDYDSLKKLGSLEYPIHFTYHHLMNMITDDASLSYCHRKYLIEKIIASLDNLTDYISDYDEENYFLITMINDIDERCDLIREKTLYKRCEYMLFLFDEIVEGFKTAEKYLYFRPYPYHELSSDDESGNESGNESDNESSDNEADNEADNESSDNESDTAKLDKLD